MCALHQVVQTETEITLRSIFAMSNNTDFRRDRIANFIPIFSDVEFKLGDTDTPTPNAPLNNNCDIVV